MKVRYVNYFDNRDIDKIIFRSTVKLMDKVSKHNRKEILLLLNGETGEYDPYHDTNNGEGWDKDGQHFNTWDEYCKYEDESMDRHFQEIQGGNSQEVIDFMESIRGNN